MKAHNPFREWHKIQPVDLVASSGTEKKETGATTTDPDIANLQVRADLVTFDRGLRAST